MIFFQKRKVHKAIIALWFFLEQKVHKAFDFFSSEKLMIFFYSEKLTSFSSKQFTRLKKS